MRKFLILYLLLIAFQGVFAQQTKTQKVDVSSVEPMQQVSKDTSLKTTEESYDFGKIPQGKPVHHDFEIVNTGNKPIKLVTVQASCGCTTPEWEKDKEIAPGGKSTIKVGYNAANEGAFNKFITITYNENQTKQIVIKGEVWKTPSTSAPINNTINDLKE
jgi:hypothetical protein